MIRPVSFGYNHETAVNNAFQKKGIDDNVQQKALKEFDEFVNKLQKASVDITVINDTIEPHAPDSIFPNNWISFHEDGSIILYPMYAKNRRAERKPHVIEIIKEKFNISNIIDLSAFEAEGKFLEGTGSIVLDRGNKIAYACLSPRTDQILFQTFCGKTGFTPCLFHAADTNGNKIYHTNVMMCVGDKYVVICMESIKNENEKMKLKETITSSGKEIVEISMAQMNSFAGNMLQVLNSKDEKILIMSTQAYGSLTQIQIEKLNSYNQIIHSSLKTIETNGGGSARCMMAEIFLGKK